MTVSVEVPKHGGSLTGHYRKATIHQPLSKSDADQISHNLSTQAYGAIPEANFPDLADHYDISDDGLTYTLFSVMTSSGTMGEPIGAADVYPLSTRCDMLAIKVLAVRADGVNHDTSPQTIIFKLKQPYAQTLGKPYILQNIYGKTSR